MDRRDISKVLLGSVAGSALLSERAQAQTCVAPCYPKTAAESSAGVTPTNYAYPPYSDSRRYGAACDGATDDSAALQRQINSCIAAGAEMVLGQGGTTGTGYILHTPLVIAGQIKIRGGGYGKTAIVTIGCNAFNIAAGTFQVQLSDFRIANNVRWSDVHNSLAGINIQGGVAQPANCFWHTYQNLFIDGYKTAIQANGVHDTVFENIRSAFCCHGIISENFSVNCFVNNCVLTGAYNTNGNESYGVKIGDGVTATEGWCVTNSTFQGFATTIWGFGSSNCMVMGCQLDFFSKYGVLLQSGAAIAATNWEIVSNYMACGYDAGYVGVRCLSSYISSDPRGNRIAFNDIFAYPFGGATLSWGIRIDGTEEVRNVIIGNSVKANAPGGADCKIDHGAGHIVSGNNWRGNGFVSNVMATYEGNQGTSATPTMTRQTNGPNFIYHGVGAPLTGTYLSGDIAWNMTPVAGGPPGYVCVAAGSPGTWKAMANLAA